jgi:hypothetical protein
MTDVNLFIIVSFYFNCISFNLFKFDFKFNERKYNELDMNN